MQRKQLFSLAKLRPTSRFCRRAGKSCFFYKYYYIWIYKYIITTRIRPYEKHQKFQHIHLLSVKKKTYKKLIIESQSMSTCLYLLVYILFT